MSFSEQTGTPTLLVGGLIAVSCIDLLEVHIPSQRKSWSVGTFTAMTGMCSPGRYLLVLKHNRWVVTDPQGGETLAKPLIAPLDQYFKIVDSEQL